jgi:hypothetical protein
MASIGVNTKHKVSVPTTKKPAASKPPTLGIGKAKKAVKKAAATGAKRGDAPPLKPNELDTPQKIAELKAMDEANRKNRVMDLCRKAMGDETLVDKSQPHAASTTRDRSGAAADVAVAAKELGIAFVLRKCEVINSMQMMLFPDGIGAMFKNEDAVVGGLKASTSALSLASMDTNGSGTSGGTSLQTDSKRGKTTPADAREGSMLILRALCETIGAEVEPFVVGAFLAAALDECGSNSSQVRQAAEDTASALISLANPWAFPCLVCPLLLQALKAFEWRVKVNALDRLAQCAETSPAQVCRMLPTLIPAVSGVVFDTKAQVVKSASSALLAICSTNPNPDIKDAIPAVVNAISKPSETNKAIEELMGTTFVVAVDAATLSTLCPVLARALKEKLVIHKRAACIVISNMSRLVSRPDDVAPFGPLLVPELKKVATNVQFEDIRDEALKALANLTKALGNTFEDDSEEAARIAEEKARVDAERKRIEDEREAERKKEEEIAAREAEERRKFKEAMDAQRELDKLQAEEEARQKEEANKKKEAARLSTKGTSGKCQGCGLKKCKKTCLFYKG